MKENKVICDVSTDEKITEDTRYVTIDIANVDNLVLSYLKANGKKCLFTDRIKEKRGFVYVDYTTFFKAQLIVDDIINNIPNGLNQLEITRYLYISLGKIVGYDINTDEEKNGFLNFNNISLVNNIWNALAIGKVSNISLAKLYLYLCSLCNIKCEIIKTTDNYLANKVTIGTNTMILNLSKDLFNIQSGFPTVAFSSYNNDISLDKKIGYIKDEYNDFFINKALSDLDYFDENIIEMILFRTQEILDVSKIKSFELGLIYKYIFSKYCANFDIVINNLYVNGRDRQHFILISFSNKHYSYNYKKHTFTIVTEENLVSSLMNKEIGLYEKEEIPMLNKALTL